MESELKIDFEKDFSKLKVNKTFSFTGGLSKNRPKVISNIVIYFIII